jgi:hypothetical protein
MLQKLSFGFRLDDAACAVLTGAAIKQSLYKMNVLKQFAQCKDFF